MHCLPALLYRVMLTGLMALAIVACGDRDAEIVTSDTGLQSVTQRQANLIGWTLAEATARSGDFAAPDRRDRAVPKGTAKPRQGAALRKAGRNRTS